MAAMSVPVVVAEREEEPEQNNIQKHKLLIGHRQIPTMKMKETGVWTLSGSGGNWNPCSDRSQD